MSFTWIPYYKEFAQRLTQFQKDRKRLLNLIYDNRDELLAKYLHDQGGEGDLLEDIDPFTVFGLFNRGIKHENRINSAKLFKNIRYLYLEPSKQLQTMKNTWRQTFVYQLLLDFNTSNLLFGGSQKSAYLCNAFLPRRILRAFILPSRGQS